MWGGRVGGGVASGGRGAETYRRACSPRAPPPRMVRPGFPLLLRRLYGHWGFILLLVRDRACRDFFPTELLPSVVNLDSAILPLAYRHLALRRRVMQPLPLHLIEAVRIAYHPVIAQRPFPL